VQITTTNLELNIDGFPSRTYVAAPKSAQAGVRYPGIVLYSELTGPLIAWVCGARLQGTSRRRERGHSQQMPRELPLHQRARPDETAWRAVGSKSHSCSYSKAERNVSDLMKQLPQASTAPMGSE
jgi:hypothetical protein